MKMRMFKTEAELRTIAEQISEHITIRTEANGCSHDEQRKTTPEEAHIIYHLVYGALLAMNWGEQVRMSKVMPQAIIDATEFQCDLLLRDLLNCGEECNGYDTIYCPLQRALREWKQIGFDD